MTGLVFVGNNSPSIAVNGLWLIDQDDADSVDSPYGHLGTFPGNARPGGMGYGDGKLIAAFQGSNYLYDVNIDNPGASTRLINITPSIRWPSGIAYQSSQSRWLIVDVWSSADLYSLTDLTDASTLVKLGDLHFNLNNASGIVDANGTVYIVTEAAVMYRINLSNVSQRIAEGVIIGISKVTGLTWDGDNNQILATDDTNLYSLSKVSNRWTATNIGMYPSQLSKAAGIAYVQTNKVPEWEDLTVETPDLYYRIGGTGRSTRLPRATGGDLPLTYNLKSSKGENSAALPAGMSFSTTTGTISGVPTERQDPGLDYTYSVTDSNGDILTWGSTFNIETDNAGSFGSNTVSDLLLRHNTPFDPVVLPEASGGFGETSYSITPALPAGVEFDPATRTLSGTPTVVSTVPVRYLYSYAGVDASLSVSPKVSLSFTIFVEVDSMPSFSVNQIQPIRLERNELVNIVLPEGISGDRPLTYSLIPQLPDGLAFNASRRLISGRTTQPHPPTDYTYIVSDEDGDTAFLVFSLGVVGELRFLVSKVPDQLYRVGVPVNEVLPEAIDGGAKEYSLVSETHELPAGLVFTPATRTISGTPVKTRSLISMLYQVHDTSTGVILSIPMSLTVLEDNQPSIPNIDEHLEFTVGIRRNYTLPESGGDPPITHTIIPDRLPDGIEFNPDTRIIGGIATTVTAETPYTYKAVDRDGQEDTEAFTLSVVSSVPSFALGEPVFSVNAATVLFDYLTNGDFGPSILVEDMDLESWFGSQERAGTIVQGPGNENYFKDYDPSLNERDGTNYDTWEASFLGHGFLSSIDTGLIEDLKLGINTDPQPLLRYEFNGQVPTSRDYPFAIETIMNTMPGSILFRAFNGKWKLSLPDSETPEGEQVGDNVFTDEDFVQMPVVKIPDTNEKINRYRMDYINANKQMAKDDILVPSVGSVLDLQLQSEDGVVLQESSEFEGVINTYHATSIAVTSLLLSRRRTFELTLSPKGVLLEPGDVIFINSKTLNLTAYMRIHEMSILSNLDVKIMCLEFVRSDYAWTVTDKEKLNLQAVQNTDINPPTLLRVAYDEETHIASVEWSPPDVKSAEITHYEVQYSEVINDRPTSWQPLNIISQDAARIASHLVVFVTTNYRYRVRSIAFTDEVSTWAVSPTLDVDGSLEGLIGIEGEDGLGYEYIYAIVARDVDEIPALQLPDNDWTYDMPGTSGGLVWNDGAITPTYDEPRTFWARRRIRGAPEAGDDVEGEWEKPILLAEIGFASVYPTVPFRSFTWKYTKSGSSYQYIPSAPLTRTLETEWFFLGELIATTHAIVSIDSANPEQLKVTGTGGSLKYPDDFQEPVITNNNTSEVLVSFIHTDTGYAATLQFLLDEKPLAATDFPRFRGVWNGDAPGTNYLEGDTVVVYYNVQVGSATVSLPSFFVSNEAHLSHPTDNAPTRNQKNTWWTPSTSGDLFPSFGSRTQESVQYKVGDTVMINLPSAGGGNGPLVYTLSQALPAGLAFSAAARTISGTPTRIFARSNYIYTVTDSDGDKDTITFSIEIVAAAGTLTISYVGQISDLEFNENQFGSAILAPAINGSGPKTYIIGGNVPPGMQFTPSTRRLYGTPTIPGSYTTWIQASDDTGTSRDTFVITVQPDTPEDLVPEFGDDQIDDVTGLTEDPDHGYWIRYLVGSRITPLQLPVPDDLGNGAHTYTLTGLPSRGGLSFNASTRTISGTPVAPHYGRYSIQYAAHDADGDSAAFHIFYIHIDRTVAFGFTGQAQSFTATVGVAVSRALPSIQGGRRPYSGNTGYISQLPPGLVRATLGEYGVGISGTPTTAGTYEITLSAQDAAGTQRTQKFTITVNARVSVPSAPSSVSIDNDGYTDGVKYVGGMTASWSAVSGATSYDTLVQYRHPTTRVWTNHDTSNTTSRSYEYTWKALDVIAIEWRITVRAKNSAGASGYKASASVNPPNFGIISNLRVVKTSSLRVYSWDIYGNFDVLAYELSLRNSPFTVLSSATNLSRTRISLVLSIASAYRNKPLQFALWMQSTIAGRQIRGHIYYLSD